MYTVYLRANTVNGKKYVGQTGDFKTRNKKWNCQKAKYANNFLTKERNIYGLDVFETIILAEVETQEEAWELEQYYIKELNTKYPNGYNLAIGGAGNKGALKGISFTEEHKCKISESLKGHYVTQETRNKIGRIHKDKIITEEHKKRISQKLGKSVLQIDKNTNDVIAEFPSTREVEKQLGYVHNCISACCRGKQRTAYGYKWVFKT